MKTNYILTITLLLASFIAFSQVSENRNLSDFSKLNVAQGIEVFYTISNSNSIKVETDDNDRLQFIKTKVEGETLKIFIDTKNVTNSKSEKIKGIRINGVNFNILKVYVTGKSLTNIKASSSANIEIINLNTTEKLEINASSSGSVSGKFECTDFETNVSSSGTLKADVNAKSVFIDISSSGAINLDGTASNLDIKASSSGECRLKGFLVENAIIKASSSADVTINVSKSLDAAASTSAVINYYGKPSQVNTDKSTSGSINKR